MSNTHAHATAAILSIGDELVLGQTLNSNSRWLATQLANLGILTREHVTIPDDASAHAAALRRLAECCDVIISTGGLGPTDDDLTRVVMSDVLASPLIEDPRSLEQIQAWFTSRARGMPEINRSQAKRPQCATAIANAHGTAPGLHACVTTGSHACDVYCLPGPPSEMIPMFEGAVRPGLRPPASRRVLTRAMPCFGIGESEVAMRLGAIMARDAVPLIGTTASGGVVTCRIRYEGDLDEADASALLEQTQATIRRLLAPHVFGDGEVTLADAVVRLLAQRKRTLGVVESCTGGLLGSMITSVPGSSESFRGGLITYANEQKIALAGVDPALLADSGPGAVSKEVARAVALGGLSRLGCDECIAVTGIAGPGGSTEATSTRPAKPVGLVYIALARRLGTEPRVEVRRFHMRGDRASVRDWSAKSALMMLHMALMNVPIVRMLREESLT
jgi:nicotinamide-nucleotide amidase